MAFLLTALSVNATIGKSLEDVHSTSTALHQIDSNTFGTGVPYFIDSTQQEIYTETEQEHLPISLDDNPFFATSGSRRSTLLNILQYHKKTPEENASFSKYYTKQILFPFHSHW